MEHNLFYSNEIKTPTGQSLPSFLQRPSSSSFSSADLAQPVVCPGVGYDGLNSYDGLVDLRLQLPELLDVQQTQDLGCFIQCRIWKEMITFYFPFPYVRFYHTAPRWSSLGGFNHTTACLGVCQSTGRTWASCPCIMMSKSSTHLLYRNPRCACLKLLEHPGQTSKTHTTMTAAQPTETTSSRVKWLPGSTIIS